ncbi:MAG: hypothetical protein KAU90_12440, partial [Sulfurovaceae bacterium]|nr:hypothetical protein [Sulfurovaceae bacterium]
MELKYQPKDMLYNNGIVNLYHFLEDMNLDIEVSLNNSLLLLTMKTDNSKEIFFEILKEFFKKYKIVHQTKNDRWYFDGKKQNFILDKKFDTVGGQKNDLRNGIYLYKNISEFGLDREYVEGLYLDFCKKYNQKIEQNSNGTLKVPNKKNEVIIAITLDIAIERFTNYFVSSDILKRDSKIHTFEDGQGTFHDMVKPSKSYTIDKWDALIYWFGGRIQRFYNRDYFIYPNSSDLKALEKFKEFLKIDNERIIFRDDKEKLISTTSNIDFYKQLKN